MHKKSRLHMFISWIHPRGSETVITLESYNAHRWISCYSTIFDMKEIQTYFCIVGRTHQKFCFKTDF